MKTGNKNDILIMIPAYNEEGSIEFVVDNIINNYPQYDYVIINDGSTDSTRKICKNNKYNLLDLPANTGLSGAIKSGMRYANFNQYEYVVQLDGDGQHDPKYIQDMFIRMQKTNADIVIGSRFIADKKKRSFRMLGSTIIEILIWLTTRGTRITDVTSGMRLFNKRMIKKFGYEMNYSPEPDTLAYLINCGVYIEEIPVKMKERFAGNSYLSISKSINYMLQMFFSIVIFQWVRKKV